MELESTRTVTYSIEGEEPTTWQLARIGTVDLFRLHAFAQQWQRAMVEIDGSAESLAKLERSIADLHSALAEHVRGFSGMTRGGEPIPFSAEAVREILMKRGDIQNWLCGELTAAESGEADPGKDESGSESGSGSASPIPESTVKDSTPLSEVGTVSRVAVGAVSTTGA